MILPYLEQQSLYSLWNPDLPFYQTFPNVNGAISIYFCP